MSRAEKLLGTLLERGARIRAEGGELVCRVRRGALPPELHRELQERKAELLGLLERDCKYVQVSFAQQRLWFLQQLEPRSTIYNVYRGRRLRGPLLAAVLEASLREIARRHEALRTSFPSFDARPCQKIDPKASPALACLDLGALPQGRRDAEARRVLTGEAGRPFDLALAPPVRFLLLRLAAGEHVFFHNVHHVVFDGWSDAVFHRELTSLYATLAAGRRPSLPELSVQYADFAVWQRQWLRGEVLETQLGYWRRQLAGLPTLALPTDRPRPAVRTYRGSVRSLTLPPELCRSLRRLGTATDASLFMTLLAAFMVLLSRVTSQRDVVVGSPIANRHRLEIEGLIGFFVNTLVLRGDLGGASSFEEWIGRVKKVCLEAYDHQDLPFEKLVEELHPSRDLKRSPLFQVMLVFQNVRAEAATFPDVLTSPFAVGSEGTHFDLTVSVAETEGGLRVTFRHDTELFHATTLSRLARHYETLLRHFAEDPSRPPERAPILTEAERQQLLVEWNETTSYPATPCLHQLFEAQARRSPEAVAWVFGDERLSYAELDRRSHELAGRLAALGVGPEARVGLLLPRSLEMVVSLLAVLKAGGAYVPIDPDLPARRREFFLADSGAEVLVTRSELAEKAGSLPLHKVLLDAEADAVPAPVPVRPVAPENLAYVIYTSGSTGRPKGVGVTHGNVARLLAASQERFQFGPEDVGTLFHSYAFDFSVWELWGALAYGGRLVGVPHWVSRSPEDFLELLVREGVTVLNQTPSAFRQLAAVADAPAGLALRQVIFGGEALDPSSLGSWLDGRGPRLVNMYGITETTVHVTYRPLRPSDRRCVIGRPLPDLELHLLDARLQPVPVGAAGEIHVGGAGLVRGYLGRPGRTAERFVPHPFSEVPGARLYKSGDLARRLPDGDPEYLGRIDHQVKVRGHRVELGEVEAVLKRHPGLRQAVVVARPSGASGDLRLVGYGVAGKLRPSVRELRSFLGRHLPEVMIPAPIVLLDALPLTVGGKVDRRALPEPEEPGPPERALPRTPSEELLLAIWEGVLERSGIGVHDSFFELGGHSLLATQVVSRVRRIFGVDLPVRSVFERPVLSELAAEVDARRRSEPAWTNPPLVPGLAKRSAEVPLSFAQQRLWFLQELTPASSAYNMPSARRLEGRLDPAALHGALREVARRHEVLRTRFPATGGRPRQEVAPAGTWILPLVDLTALEPEARRGEARRRLAAESRRPYRLSSEVPLRCHLWRLGAEDHVLFVDTHHVASDGWSQGVMNRELSVLYGALAAGREPDLPELAVQYADYAVWQREWLRGEVPEGQLAYWRKELAGAAVLELPADRPRPALGAETGARLPFVFSEELSRSLRELSVETGVSLYMTLLAAFVTLLHRLTGQSDVVVGSPIANRRYEEVEGLIGFFVNTLVLRSRPAPRLSFGDLLAQTRQLCLDAYLHQDLPFEKLVEELDPERDLAHSPLFQVMLALQNTPREDVRMANVRASLFPFDAPRAHFDLNVSFHETDGRLIAHLSYNAGLFDRTTMERLARRFRVLLGGATEDPGRSLESLAMLRPGERHQLLVEHNDTASAGSWRLLTERFEFHARRQPREVAVSFAGERLTYGELERRANRLANYLRHRGVGPEAVVGLCVEPSFERVVAMLAILKAGGAYLPLDPGYPRSRLAFMIGDARVRLLVTEERLLGVLPAGDVETLCLDADRELVALAGDELPRSGVTPENVAYVIYTSGSTGRPKAILVRHRGASNNLDDLNASFGVGRGDRVLALSSVSFDMSVYEVFGLLGAGGTVVIPEAAEAREPAAWSALLDRHGVTVWNTAPALLEMLVAHLEEGGGPRPRLKVAILGGDWVPVTLPDRLKALVPGVRVIVLGGATEASIHSIVFPVEVTDPRWRSIPYGRPMRNQEACLFDAGLRAVPLGVAGELYLGGVGLARGYLGRPALTAEKFVPKPFTAAGGRLYKTGDLARRLFDGTIELLGRIDRQVKLRGFRVELGEVTAVLKSHPGIRDAVVVARTVRQEGSAAPTAEKRLIAYFVPRDGDAPSGPKLWDFLKVRLPGYMVPSVFSPLDALPLSPNGKIDHRSLPEPEPAPAESLESFVEPRTPVETVVSEIWAEALERDSVGAHDNFFALGGHSLLATQVFSRLQKLFRIELPLRLLFESPTVAGLGERIERLAELSGLDAPRIAKLLIEVDQLPEDEVVSMLAGNGPIGLKS